MNYRMLRSWHSVGILHSILWAITRENFGGQRTPASFQIWNLWTIHSETSFTDFDCSHNLPVRRLTYRWNLMLIDGTNFVYSNSSSEEYSLQAVLRAENDNWPVRKTLISYSVEGFAVIWDMHSDSGRLRPSWRGFSAALCDSSLKLRDRDILNSAERLYAYSILHIFLSVHR